MRLPSAAESLDETINARSRLCRAGVGSDPKVSICPWEVGSVDDMGVAACGCESKVFRDANFVVRVLKCDPLDAVVGRSWAQEC